MPSTSERARSRSWLAENYVCEVFRAEDEASKQIINKQNMADTENSTNNNEDISSENAEKMDIAEPESKKRKLEAPEKESEYKLEERLNGILCCAVCLDLPPQAVFQVRPKHWSCVTMLQLKLRFVLS